MKAYPDASFLCALYRLQVNSREAAAYFAGMPEPLEVTTLLLLNSGGRFRVPTLSGGKLPGP